MAVGDRQLQLSSGVTHVRKGRSLMTCDRGRGLMKLL